MPRRLHAIATAMEAYTWTRGKLTEGPDDAPSYCAVGALLRHAGVPRARIARGSVASLLTEYAPLLRARYGISDADLVSQIVAANDGSVSRAQATWRVLGLASGVVEGEAAPPRTATASGGPQVPPAA